MNKTKLASIIFAVVLIFGMTGCAGEQPSGEVVMPGEISVTVGEAVSLPSPLDEYTVCDPSVATCNGAEIIGFHPGATAVKNASGDIVYNVTVVPNELGTTHVYDVRESEISLVQGGQTEYVLVIPAGETDEMITEIAVSEFNDLFSMATGLTLPVMKDDAMAVDTEGKYIFLGNTRQAAARDIYADRETFGQSGFRMRTIGNSLYCVGGGRFGTLYTVYEFMKWQFGFAQYAADEMSIDTNVTDCMLLDFNIVDIPDFEWRVASYGDVFLPPFTDYYPHRMRVQRLSGELFVPIGGDQYVHNYLDYIPPEKYQAEHPEWFSTDGTQLCLTRDVEGLSDEVVEIMKDYLTAYPEISCISFTQEDKNTWCRCQSCKALYDEYGTDAATNIKFINVVAKKLKAWLQETDPDRTVRLTIFAYHMVEDAPAVLNAETGEYEPMDESVVLDDMVTVFYAPIFASYYQELDSAINERLDTNMRKWSALTDAIFLWIYQLSCDNYLQPYDGINSLQERLTYAYEHKVELLFDQAEYNMETDTDWMQLKSYLLNRMMWDIRQDPYEIITEFITHYFKQASAPMQKLYDSWKQWMGYAHLEFGLTGVITENLVRTDVFPEPVLDEWLGYIDEAYVALEPLRHTDPEMYERLERRICVESISIRYLKMMLYRDSMSVEGWRDWYLRFKADAARVGVTNYNEWNAMSPMLENKLLERYPDLSTVYPDLF